MTQSTHSTREAESTLAHLLRDSVMAHRYLTPDDAHNHCKFVLRGAGGGSIIVASFSLAVSLTAGE